MLGTRARLSILPTNIDLRPVEIEQPGVDKIITRSRANAIESLEEKITNRVPSSHRTMVTRSKTHSNEFIEERITRNRTTSSDGFDEKVTQSNISNDFGEKSTQSKTTAIKSFDDKVTHRKTVTNESFDKKMLNNMEVLMKKSADSFEVPQQERLTHRKTVTNESFDKKMLNNIEVLLKKNADSFEVLQQERQQLLKMERMLKEKLQCDLEAESTKENEAPNENTPSKLFLVPREPDKLGNKTNGQNSIIEEMRSSIKFLKTPRPNRMSRKSIILTPHSMSFCIQKQFEDLLE